MRDDAKVRNNEARRREFEERMGNKRKAVEEDGEETEQRGRLEAEGEMEEAREADQGDKRKVDEGEGNEKYDEMLKALGECNERDRKRKKKRA